MARARVTPLHRHSLHRNSNRPLICDTFPNADGDINDDHLLEANQRFLATLLLCTSHNLEKSLYMTVITETDGAQAQIRRCGDNGPNASGTSGAMRSAGRLRGS